MEYLTSLPEYLLSVVQGTDFTEITDCKVNYHWGDEYELNRYLSVDQDDSFGKLLMSGKIETQYPLIWLAPAYEFSPYDVSEELLNFDNVKIIFLKRGNPEYLNKQRWRDSMHELYGVANTFKDKLKRDSNSELVGNDYTWIERPNYSRTEAGDKENNATIDYCDALILKIKTLRIDTECFKYLDQTC